MKLWKESEFVLHFCWILSAELPGLSAALLLPCLQGLLNTSPTVKTSQRGKNKGKSGWAHPGLQRKANTKANSHLSVKIPLHGLCVCVVGVCRACVHASRKSLPKAQLPSCWRMVPLHLIYISRKWTIHFFFHPVVCFSAGTPSLTSLPLLLFQFSLSHNFFQSRCPTLPSSLKLCWGPNLELQPSSRNVINPNIPILTIKWDRWTAEWPWR